MQTTVRIAGDLRMESGREDSVQMHALDSHPAHSLVIMLNDRVRCVNELKMPMCWPVLCQLHPFFIGHGLESQSFDACINQKLLGCTSFTCLEISPAQPFRQRSLLCWPWAVGHKCKASGARQTKCTVTTRIATRNTQQSRCQEYSCNTSRATIVSDHENDITPVGLI